MNKILFAACISLVGGLSAAQAYDSDPGYNAPGSGGASDKPAARSKSEPAFYRPTQRYYGNGYVISYRYVPAAKKTGKSIQSPTFAPESSAFMTADQMAASGASGPKVTYVYSKGDAKRADVKAVVKTPTLQQGPPPPVAEGPVKKP